RDRDGESYSRPAPRRDRDGESYSRPAPRRDRDGESYSRPAPRRDRDGESYSRPAPRRGGESYGRSGPRRDRDGEGYTRPGPRRDREGAGYSRPGPRRDRDGESDSRSAPRRERDLDRYGRSGTPRERDGGAAGRPGRYERDSGEERRATSRGPRAPRLDLPEGITADRLDPEARAELRTLPRDLADAVAAWLVAAATEEDPDRAFEYAVQARKLAARVGVVRETAGVAAYRAGRWADALAELRTARRLTGRASYLPLMADAERALGRPDRALALIHDPDSRELDRATQIELAIVESGIRRDQGRAAAADPDEDTDAAERYEIMDSVVIEDLADDEPEPAESVPDETERGERR